MNTEEMINQLKLYEERIKNLENELRMLQTNPNVKVSDEEIKSYNDAIADLNFAINQL